MVRFFIFEGNAQIDEVLVQDGQYVPSSSHDERAMDLVSFLNRIRNEGGWRARTPEAFLANYASSTGNAYSDVQLLAVDE